MNQKALDKPLTASEVNAWRLTIERELGHNTFVLKGCDRSQSCVFLTAGFHLPNAVTLEPSQIPEGVKFEPKTPTGGVKIVGHPEEILDVVRLAKEQILALPVAQEVEAASAQC